MNLTIDNAWPSSLPLPTVQFSGEPRNATITSQDLAMALTARSRFSRSYNAIAVSWQFTTAQYDDFKNFLLNDLGNGTAMFSIELKFPKNSELTQWAVRLIEGHAAEYQDGIWKVSAALELVNPIVF